MSMLSLHKKNSYDHLEIILKTVERCNLNCSYCYFFNGGDETYKKNPAFISKETVGKVVSFLENGCKELSIGKICLNLHGGEPMLQKPRQFDEMCSLFRETLDPLVDLELVMQTNGTIFSDEWVELLLKHRVSIGISCDGPEEYHNQFRVDHKGRGSHSLVKDNILKFNKAFKSLDIKPVGLLSVINPARDPKKIYHHFTKDLGAKSIDFLLPDYTHDTFKENALTYGKFLCDLFDAWVEDDDPTITVRILEKTIKHLTLNIVQFNNMQTLERKYREFTISSSGKLGSIDVLRSASQEWMWQGDEVTSISLSEYVESNLLKKLYHALDVIPNACQTCCWKKICRGGYMINRFSKSSSFDNPSVYCSGLKLFYTHLANHLIQNGYAYNKMEKLLCSK